jgi:hypothetical protein
MLISPIHQMANALRGVKVEWNDEYQFDLELRYMLDTFVEAECHDVIIINAQIRGSVSELSEIRVLVHCKGRELETDASSCPQLLHRLGDIARMGQGIEGYHALGEETRSHITHGEELWMLWTADLVHWASWAGEPRWSHEKLIAIRLDGTWYFVHRAEAQDAYKGPELMKRILPRKLKVLPEELRLKMPDEPVIPLIEEGCPKARNATILSTLRFNMTAVHTWPL